MKFQSNLTRNIGNQNYEKYSQKKSFLFSYLSPACMVVSGWLLLTRWLRSEQRGGSERKSGGRELLEQKSQPHCDRCCNQTIIFIQAFDRRFIIQCNTQ